MLKNMYNILYQFNDKYAPYAGVSITSLIKNKAPEEEITFWILGEDVAADNRKKLDQTVTVAGCKINFIDTADLIEEMKQLNLPTYRGSYAANIRLFVSRFIPEDVKRLLYLDSDTIITGSLRDLFETDLDDNVIGAVYDSVGEAHKADLGLDDSEGYYNSGVILYDMDKWRSEGYTEKIIDHVKNVRAQYPSPDQDLLNVVCRRAIKTLPPKYNYQPFHAAYSDRLYFSEYGKTKYYTRAELEETRNDIIIYHCFRFIAEFPWNKGNVHPFTPIFDEYLRNSEWDNYQKKPSDGKTLTTTIEKLMYKCLPKSWFLPIFHMAHSRFYSAANASSTQNRIDERM